MTNQQLYLAIGIPMLTTIVGFLIQNQRLDSIQKQMDARFDSLQKQMDARFDSLQKQIDQIAQRLTGIDAALHGLYEMVGRHDEAIETLKKSRAS